MHQLECKKCGYSYSAPIIANDIYICPKCNSYVGCLCDYGFGPIVPCIIFHGDKEVAKIDYRNHTEYQLKSDAFGLDIALTKGYKNLEVYDEATKIITDALKEKSHEQIFGKGTGNKY